MLNMHESHPSKGRMYIRLTWMLNLVCCSLCKIERERWRVIKLILTIAQMSIPSNWVPKACIQMLVSSWSRTEMSANRCLLVSENVEHAWLKCRLRYRHHWLCWLRSRLVEAQNDVYELPTDSSERDQLQRGWNVTVNRVKWWQKEKDGRQNSRMASIWTRRHPFRVMIVIWSRKECRRDPRRKWNGLPSKVASRETLRTNTLWHTVALKEAGGGYAFCTSKALLRCVSW